MIKTELVDETTADAQRQITAPLRVVVIDEEFPFPMNSGKRLRTLNLLSRLAQRHRITYLAHQNQDAQEGRLAAQHLQSLGIQPLTVSRTVPPKSGWAFYGRLLLNLGSSLPYSVATHASLQMQQMIEQLEKDGQVDLWHCEWTPYFQNVRRRVARPVVTIAHNIETQIWQRYGDHERNFLKRLYIREQQRKFGQFERQAFAGSAQTVFVSQPDRDLARRSFGLRDGAVIDNGVDFAFFQPHWQPRDGRKLLMLGSLDWRPNIDGINQFVEQVMPRLREHDDQFELTIVGRNPHPSWVRQLTDRGGIRVAANVPDVRPYLQAAGLLVVPLRIGGGSRLKILEAVAAGLPVVSTAVGAEGLAFAPDQHYWSTATIEDMTSAIRQAAAASERCLEMARAAEAYARQRYDWQALALGLEQVWWNAWRGSEARPCV